MLIMLLKSLKKFLDLPHDPDSHQSSLGSLHVLSIGSQLLNNPANTKQTQPLEHEHSCQYHWGGGVGGLFCTF